MEADNQDIDVVQTTADRAGLVFRTKTEMYYFLATQCIVSKHYRLIVTTSWLTLPGSWAAKSHGRPLLYADSPTLLGSVYLPQVKSVDTYFLKQVMNGEKRVRNFNAASTAAA